MTDTTTQRRDQRNSQRRWSVRHARPPYHVLKTPTPHKPQLSHSCTATAFVSQDFCICILSLRSQVSALCFAHRHSGILVVQCHRFAYCDASTRNKESRCASISSSYALQTFRRCAATEDIHLSQVMSPSTRTNSINRRNLLVRNGQATPILQGGNVSRRLMSSSLPALPAVLLDYDIMEITNPTTMQVESASGDNSMQIVWTSRI